MDPDKHRIVHFVGSVNLASAEAVFAAIGQHVGDRAPRIPDGETGPRADWIVWQNHIFEDNPSFEEVTAIDNEIRPDQPLRVYALKPGLTPADVSFPPLGYADTAVESFKAFSHAKALGRVPVDARFMIAIPSAPAIPALMIAGGRQAVGPWLPVFEAMLIAEANAIAEALPVDQIAIQWDAAFEMNAIDKLDPALFESLAESLAVLGNATPDGIETCFHFCFGDYNGKGVPTETAAPAVRFANALAARLTRPPSLIHIPAPGDGTRAFFEPLKDLETDARTRICLGLVHERNGLAGTLDMMRAAAAVWPDFDIGAACGLGRRRPDAIPEILDLLNASARAVL